MNTYRWVFQTEPHGVLTYSDPFQTTDTPDQAIDKVVLELWFEDVVNLEEWANGQWYEV